MIFGAVDWASNFILFYFMGLTLNVIARLNGREGY